jgi:hypothetical protein
MPKVASQADFTATTLGLSTQGIPVSQACNLTAYAGPSTSFNCKQYPAFYGDLGGASWGLQFFTGASGTSNDTFNSSTNPFYWGLAAWFNNVAIDNTSLSTDPNIVISVAGGVSFVLWCNSTAYDVQYSYVNSTLQPLNQTVSNTTTSAIMAAPMYYTK